VDISLFGWFELFLFPFLFSAVQREVGEKENG
jgi:hypothetical protein